MNAPRRWRLRTALIGLLTIISSVSFITVGAILLLVRLPQIEAETRSQLQAESDELAGGTEALISALQTQIEMIASTLFVAPHIGLQSVLERAVSGRSAFDAIYQIGADGTVLRAAVGESIGGARRAELIGSNLSGHLLYRRVKDAWHPGMERQAPFAGRRQQYHRRRRSVRGHRDRPRSAARRNLHAPQPVRASAQRANLDHRPARQPPGRQRRPGASRCCQPLVPAARHNYADRFAAAIGRYPKAGLRRPTL